MKRFFGVFFVCVSVRQQETDKGGVEKRNAGSTPLSLFKKIIAHFATANRTLHTLSPNKGVPPRGGGGARYFRYVLRT